MISLVNAAVPHAFDVKLGSRGGTGVRTSMLRAAGLAMPHYLGIGFGLLGFRRGCLVGWFGMSESNLVGGGNVRTGHDVEAKYGAACRDQTGGLSLDRGLLYL